jgi:hypothetical protein
VGDSIPLLDVPETIGWHDPLPSYPVAVGALFLLARIATLLVILTIVVVDWENFTAGRDGQ